MRPNDLSVRPTKGVHGITRSNDLDIEASGLELVSTWKFRVVGEVQLWEGFYLYAIDVVKSRFFTVQSASLS